ncbi:unnamed protein product [Linum trigynum]|uniref:Uncharacterized protein n=1 Tax=Linum trigynum TaxID=586398 RepID=A0AAV2G977_9ROSI
MSVGGVMYEKVVINDDDAVTMMLQFLADNWMRLAKVYVETEAVIENHSNQYSYDDGFAGGYRWGGSSSNYGGGSFAGGVPWEEYMQHVEPAHSLSLRAFNGLLGGQSRLT